MSPSTSNDNGHIYNILILDDDAITLELIKGMLADEPIHIHSATCFEDGHRIFSEKPIDIVISDFYMPGKNGIEVLESFTREKEEIPIILMTANPKDDFLLKALKKGAFDILVKPCSEFDLSVLLHKAMESRDLQQELALHRNKKGFFKDALNQAHEGIIIYKEKDLTLVDFNKSIMKTLGVGKKMIEAEHPILPSGLIEASDSEAVLQTLKQKGHLTFKNYYRNSDGTKINCTSNLSIAKVSGENYIIDIVSFE